MRNYISETYKSKDVDELREKIDRSCAAAYIIVCCGNDLAGMALHDAIEELRKYSNMYRMGVKKAAKASEERFGKYESLLRETLSDRFQLWMDIADGVNERMSHHVFNLYMAFKQYLDENGIKLSTLRAHVFTADTLLKIAIRNFDDFFNVAKENTGKDLSRVFIPARLGCVSSSFDVVCDAVSKTDGGIGDIDFNKSPQCRLAVEVICRQIANHEMFNIAGFEALKLNPEYIDNLSDDDKRMLEEYGK